jgi:hypothetical protein
VVGLKNDLSAAGEGGDAPSDRLLVFLLKRDSLMGCGEYWGMTEGAAGSTGFDRRGCPGSDHGTACELDRAWSRRPLSVSELSCDGFGGLTALSPRVGDEKSN